MAQRILLPAVNTIPAIRRGLLRAHYGCYPFENLQPLRQSQPTFKLSLQTANRLAVSPATRFRTHELIILVLTSLCRQQLQHRSDLHRNTAGAWKCWVSWCAVSPILFDECHTQSLLITCGKRSSYMCWRCCTPAISSIFKSAAGTPPWIRFSWTDRLVLPPIPANTTTPILASWAIDSQPS